MRRIIIYMLLFIVTLGANARLSSLNDTIRHDSLLFSQSQLDVSVRPNFPFDLGMACDNYLKAKEEYEKNENHNHIFLDDHWNELADFKFDAEIAFPSNAESYEYELQDKWTSYVKIFKSLYKNKLDSVGDETAEKELLIARIERFGRQSVYKPLFYKTIAEEYYGNVRDYVDKLYETSIMSNRKAFRQFVRRPSRRKLNADMGAQMSIAIKMYQIWLANYTRLKPEKMRIFVYK